MNFDFYADLATLQACPTDGTLPSGLASGFVDGCTVWFASNDISAAKYDAQLANEMDKKRRKELQNKKRKHENAKNEARRCYMARAQAGPLNLPCELNLNPWPPQVLHADWLAIEVEFELLTPWYSKDDRPFHVLDNPVRKDRVFGVPFMAAASWKGMLRWACRMRQPLKEGKRFDAWTDPDWILHLFGDQKGEEKDFHQGALVFYPTWFDKIGFEVINPHDRSRRAGTQPIFYEVVPGRRPKSGNQDDSEEDREKTDAGYGQPKSNNQVGFQEGGRGMLRLLYAPWPEAESRTPLAEWLPNLLQAIEELLTCYGISAKRTVGWGTAEIKKWRAWRNDPQGVQTVEADNQKDLLNKLNSGGAP